MVAHKVALKYPTVTAEESPNAILRRRLDLAVIHRPVYTIPGVTSHFHAPLDIDIIRIATGGTYDDQGRAIGSDAAVSLRIVERKPVLEAARYAFDLGQKTGRRVTSASKYTVQRATDGLFEAVVREVAKLNRDVPHNVELFDALLGKLVMVPEKFQIIITLNEYGDFLSDLACGLVGSLGIGASANLAFDSLQQRPRRHVRRRARHRPRHPGEEPGQPHRDLPRPVDAPGRGRRGRRRPGAQGHRARPPPRRDPDQRTSAGPRSTDSFTTAVAAEITPPPPRPSPRPPPAGDRPGGLTRLAAARLRLRPRDPEPFAVDLCPPAGAASRSRAPTCAGPRRSSPPRPVRYEAGRPRERPGAGPSRSLGSMLSVSEGPGPRCCRPAGS